MNLMPGEFKEITFHKRGTNVEETEILRKYCSSENGILVVKTYAMF